MDDTLSLIFVWPGECSKASNNILANLFNFHGNLVSSIYIYVYFINQEIYVKVRKEFMRLFHASNNPQAK